MLLWRIDNHCYNLKWKSTTLGEVGRSMRVNIWSKKVQLVLYLALIGDQTLTLINKLGRNPESIEEFISKLDNYFEYYFSKVLIQRLRVYMEWRNPGSSKDTFYQETPQPSLESNYMLNEEKYLAGLKKFLIMYSDIYSL